MLARTINASWNQANNKTFGPGHIYRYQIRILHIKHFYPQLTDKNGNQMENLGSLTLAGLVETGFAGNVIVSDWFWPRQLPTIWPGVGIWWKAFLWNCGVGPDSTLHWRIMRALPPLSCINYNRPRCSTMLYNKKKSTVLASAKYRRVQYNIYQDTSVQRIFQQSVTQITVQCVCVLHPLQQEQERHYDIFSVSPTYNPQHANSYIYSFPYT